MYSVFPFNEFGGVMKKLKLMLAVLALAVALVGANSHAGHEGGDGGLFVNVGGQWVPFDEAVEHLEVRYFGVSDLLTTDKEFGPHLNAWLKFFEKLSPDIHNSLLTLGESVEFRFINAELAWTIDQMPKSTIDFKSYRKAAIYRSRDGANGVIWVSLPVMRDAGQINSSRLTATQNQGFLLFHELLNVRFDLQLWNLIYPENHLTSQQISDFGVATLKAYYNNFDTLTYHVYLTKIGIPVAAFLEVSLQNKLTLMRELERTKLIYSAVPFKHWTRLYVPANGQLVNSSVVELVLKIGTQYNLNQYIDEFLKLYPNSDYAMAIKSITYSEAILDRMGNPHIVSNYIKADEIKDFLKNKGEVDLTLLDFSIIAGYDSPSDKVVDNDFYHNRDKYFYRVFNELLDQYLSEASVKSCENLLGKYTKKIACDQNLMKAYYMASSTNATKEVDSYVKLRTVTIYLITLPTSQLGAGKLIELKITSHKERLKIDSAKAIDVKTGRSKNIDPALVLIGRPDYYQGITITPKNAIGVKEK